MNKLLQALLACALLLVFAPKSAFAANPTKAQCISANEKADNLRKSGQLRAARASLLVCANPACPRVVRDDCNKNIPDVDASIPTLVFTARNGAADTSDVAITMDSEVIAKVADGKPVNVDPGQHSFTYTLSGFPPQTEKLVIREGEKNRVVSIQFGDAPKSAADTPTGRLVVTSSPTSAIAVDGKAAVMGRFDGPVSAGSHEVKVSENGKLTQTKIIEVKANDTETMNVTLDPEKKSYLPWVIVGGAAVVTAGLVVGGILLFGSSSSKGATPPQGSLGGVGLATFR